MSLPHYSAACGEHHGLVRDFGGERPRITVLCGSTRFGQTFREQNLLLTVAGEIVLSIGCDTKSDDDLAAAGVIGNDLKERLDALHKRKIDLADRVVVLNVDGYIGDSTRSEIEYAEKIGRPVFYLELVPGATLTDSGWYVDAEPCYTCAGHGCPECYGTGSEAAVATR